MKVKRLLLMGILCLFLLPTAAQDCKFSKKMSKQAQKRLENEAVLKATGFDVAFKDFNKVGTVHFVKSKSAYYLGLNFIRDIARKMDATPEDAIIIFLEDGGEIRLYPYSAVKDRGNMSLTSPMGTKFLKVYYSLNREQLKKFTTIPISRVKLQVTLRKKDDAGTRLKDEIIFEKIKSKWSANVMALAQCIYNL